MSFQKILIIVFAAAAFLAGPTPLKPAYAEDGGIIGTIQEVEGVVTVTSSGGAKVPAAVDTPVHGHDTIMTGPASRAFVLLIDNTELTLSENTTLRLDDYVYDNEDTTENKGVYSILQGTFLYVSGLVAKKENPDVTVNTPYGAIGIRGTEFWGGDIDGVYGILVNDGRVSVRNESGTVALAKGEGTTLRSRREAPLRGMRWGDEKIQRAVASVSLKNRAQVRQRIQQKQEWYRTLRAEHKERLRAKRGKLREKLLEREVPAVSGERRQKIRERLQR